MRSFCSRLPLTLGLIVIGLAACASGLPTSSEPDVWRPPSPEPLLEPLPGTGEEPVTLVRVRHGETLTPDDARRKLKVAVAPDDRDDWRVVGGVYEPITRTVFAPVLHFSRYALCVD